MPLRMRARACDGGLAAGARLPAPGSRLPAPGTRSRHPAPGSRSPVAKSTKTDKIDHLSWSILRVVVDFAGPVGAGPGRCEAGPRAGAGRGQGRGAAAGAGWRAGRGRCGAPDWTRTSGLPLRRRSLYPPELRGLEWRSYSRRWRSRRGPAGKRPAGSPYEFAWGTLGWMSTANTRMSEPRQQIRFNPLSHHHHPDRPRSCNRRICTAIIGGAHTSATASCSQPGW